MLINTISTVFGVTRWSTKPVCPTAKRVLQHCPQEPKNLRIVNHLFAAKTKKDSAANKTLKNTMGKLFNDREIAKDLQVIESNSYPSPRKCKH